MKEIILSKTSMFEFQCDDALTEKVLADVKSLDHNNKITWNQKYGSPQHSLAGYLDSNLGYYHKELFDWLHECIDKVSVETYCDKKLEIVDSWLTKTFLHKKIDSHCHQLSVLSGVFYLQDIEDNFLNFNTQNPEVVRLKDFYDSRLHHRPKDKTISCGVTKGKLLLFPSCTYHSMDTYKKMEPRYSIAFNTFFSGDLSVDVTTMLSIKTLTVEERYATYLEKLKQE
jgi:uncharacterized protein (TIGR02466 family)